MNWRHLFAFGAHISPTIAQRQRRSELAEVTAAGSGHLREKQRTRVIFGIHFRHRPSLLLNRERPQNLEVTKALPDSASDNAGHLNLCWELFLQSENYSKEGTFVCQPNFTRDVRMTNLRVVTTVCTHSIPTKSEVTQRQQAVILKTKTMRPPQKVRQGRDEAKSLSSVAHQKVGRKKQQDS